MSFAVVHYVSLLKKKTRRPFLKAGGCCDPAVSSVSYVTISHTPGLRIRFVRFRQTVWGVVHIVTSVRQYNRWPHDGQIQTRELRVRYPLSGIRDPGSGIRDPTGNWQPIKPEFPAYENASFIRS